MQVSASDNSKKILIDYSRKKKPSVNMYFANQQEDEKGRRIILEHPQLQAKSKEAERTEYLRENLGEIVLLQTSH